MVVDKHCCFQLHKLTSGHFVDLVPLDAEKLLIQCLHMAPGKIVNSPLTGAVSNTVGHNLPRAPIFCEIL